MKKEKKAVIKNSEYYYKKASLNELIKRFVAPALLSVVAMAGIMTYRHIQYSDKEFVIKDNSGYTQYLEDEKESLKEKLDRGEISQNLYQAYLEDFSNQPQHLEGYLKNTGNAYYLTEFKKNNSAKNKETLIIGGSTMSFVVALGVVELIRTCICTSKGNKLKKQEKEEFSCSCEKEFKDFIKKRHDAILSPKEKTNTEISY